MVYLSLHIPCPFDMVPRAASDVFKDSRDGLISEQNLVWLWIIISFHAHAFRIFLCSRAFRTSLGFFISGVLCARKKRKNHSTFSDTGACKTRVLLYMVKDIQRGRTFEWSHRRSTRWKGNLRWTNKFSVLLSAKKDSIVYGRQESYCFVCSMIILPCL